MMLASIKDIGKLFIFVIGGLVAKIVGSFMIRGTMHMWDNVDEEKRDIGNKKTKKWQVENAIELLQDSTIRKSLDNYIKRRIKEIPSEIEQTFPNIKKIWKCNDELDFLYGYYVGKIEEGSLHYLLKATRASAGGYVDTFEIRGIIEENKNQLQNTIKSALN